MNCSKCFSVFTDINKFISHLKEQHQIKNSTLKLTPIRCPKCPKEFQTFSGLQRHLGNCFHTTEYNELPQEIIAIENLHLGIQSDDQCLGQFKAQTITTIQNTLHEVEPTNEDRIAEKCETHSPKHKSSLSQHSENDEHYFNFEFPKLDTSMGERSNDLDILFEDVTDVSMEFGKMDKFLKQFNHTIDGLNIRHKDKDMVFNMCMALVDKSAKLTQTLINENTGFSAHQAVDKVRDVIKNGLSKLNTQYKRDKNYKRNLNYVMPRELALGTRWDMRRDKRTAECIQFIPQIIQSTFQYISIVETLRSIFEMDEFRDMFFAHNSESEHTCVEGQYKHFCCGRSYQSNSFFKENRYCVHIQIAHDDFEICNPLQSKANLYKVCGVYFIISNIPKKFLSKLNNIFLVALFNPDDTKTMYADFNDIWEIIVADISYMENIGIDVNGINVRGTLIHVACDNLGANSSLGFSGSFSSRYFCRICECEKQSCQQLLVAVPEKYRTKETYRNQLQIIENSTRVDLQETTGIKRYCVLSDLKHFHIIDNPTIDIMHDVNEGAIPFCLKFLILHCIASESKVLASVDELNSILMFFDYGFISRRNKPSKIILEKHNIGQNATQSKCLLINLPFILHKHRDKLRIIWECVATLLRIIEIVYSEDLKDSDIDRLEIEIQQHLQSIQTHFKQPLLPKHHNMTHYAHVIRIMGPLIFMSMFRFERKHKILKDFARQTNNYMNIYKTLATRHQQQLSTSEYTFRDIIHAGEKMKYECDLFNHVFGEHDVSEIKYLQLNNFEFRKSLVVLHSNDAYKINTILSCNENYYFVCKKVKMIHWNNFLNALKVCNHPNNDSILINFNDLLIKKPFEIRKVEEEEFIIPDSLELRKFFEKV